MALASYVYNKEISSDRLVAEIATNAVITIALDHIDTVASVVTIWFKAALSAAENTELDAIVAAHVNTPLASPPVRANTTSELITTWAELKVFYTANLGCFLNYIDVNDHYYIWMGFREQKIYIPKLEKGSADAIDFDANYKAICNLGEAPKVRIETCRYGRKLQSRYIPFITSDQNNYDNTDWLERDLGDVTYIMIDVDRNVTTNNALAKETWIDIWPQYSYEVMAGKVFIPSVLTGDEDAWELHVVIAPDIPAEYGGQHSFLVNPRIKWFKGNWVVEDCSINPANINFYPGLPANKMRFIIKHPVGAQCEFQVQLKIFIDS